MKSPGQCNVHGFRIHRVVIVCYCSPDMIIADDIDITSMDIFAAT